MMHHWQYQTILQILLRPLFLPAGVFSTSHDPNPDTQKPLSYNHPA